MHWGRVRILIPSRRRVSGGRACSERGRVNAKVDKAELKISAYGQVLSSLSSLSTAFSGLNDAEDFNDYTLNVNGALTSDGSTVFRVSDNRRGRRADRAGVTSVATKDRGIGGGYAATNTAINGGNTITLGITIGSTTTNVTVATATPQGIVDAVNAANLGIDASLVNTVPRPILMSCSRGSQGQITRSLSPIT